MLLVSLRKKKIICYVLHTEIYPYIIIYIHNIVQNAPESEFIIDAMCFVLKDDDALCVLWLILDAALHTISGSMILKP